METKKLKCEHCGYEWESKTKMFYVNCPRCLKKVKIKDNKEDGTRKIS